MIPATDAFHFQISVSSGPFAQMTKFRSSPEDKNDKHLDNEAAFYDKQVEKQQGCWGAIWSGLL